MDWTWIETFGLNYALPVGVAYLLAWIVHRLAQRIAGHFVDISGYTPGLPRLRQTRQHTLRDLLGSLISFAAFLLATLLALSRVVDTTTLIWMLGLFNVAFGFGARPIISDILTGLSFLFEDDFDVGEKVEVVGIEGVVEKIGLRTMLLRAPSGELYIVPNGEVRVIRNFSRGRFSASNITIKIAASDLNAALPVLELLGHEAVSLLPNLVEPWQVISPAGVIGETVELTLLVKTRFGLGADTRPRLLALVQERLADINVSLVG